jgi:hypothetical protein
MCGEQHATLPNISEPVSQEERQTAAFAFGSRASRTTELRRHSSQPNRSAIRLPRCRTVLVGFTALLAAAAAVLWVVSFPWHVGYNPAATSWWDFGVANGAMIIMHAAPERLPLSGLSSRWYAPAWQTALTPRLERQPDLPRPPLTVGGQTVPCSPIPGYTLLMIPLWPFVVVFAAGAVLLWRRRFKARAPGLCACGYNLTGNVSGRCPECGCVTEST